MKRINIEELNQIKRMISLAYDKNYEFIKFANENKEENVCFEELHHSCLFLEKFLNKANIIRKEVVSKVEVVNKYIKGRE